MAMLPHPPEPARDHAAVASQNLGSAPAPVELLDRLGGGQLFLLESAGEGSGPEQGRWSMMGTHPAARFVSAGGLNRFHWHSRGRNHQWREEPLAALRRVLAAFPSVPPDPVLPFQGGAVGLFSYELGRRLLPIRPRALDDLGLPEISVFFHERVLLFDHHRYELHALAYARGENEASARREAELRAALLAETVGEAMAEEIQRPALPPEAMGELPLRSRLPEADYRRAVERCREEILSGNAYELCLTGRFETAFEGDPVSLYRILREENPAPYASFFRHPEGLLLGSSPERFLRLSPTGHVEARPIKGTRPRGGDSETDAALRRELLDSAKDRAENVMIVDLLRNDLHRVCAPGSVEVSELCGIEEHAGVFQMVSTIEGELGESRDRCDLLDAAFPGGSMTGAPKIAAMNILEELEPVARGWYSGCQGYLGFDGAMDLSIVIRGIQLVKGRALVGAGGAVVYDSNPEAEWLEALHKAAAPLRALALYAGERLPDWLPPKKRGARRPQQTLQRPS